VKTCQPDEVYIAKCNNDPRQRFDLLIAPEKGEDSGDEIFYISIPGSNLCLERDHKSILLRECDIQSDLQQWKAINGSLNGNKFEISSVSKETHCVTQAHHPKSGVR
jgi:hypothetical protein